MRAPKKQGEVWLHVDRLKKKNGSVWALQYRTRTGRAVYRVAREVITLIPLRTLYFGRLARLQPKAVLVAHNARVFWKKNGVAMIGSAS